MIGTQELVSFPVFAENGKKIQPNSAKYSAGFQEADVLPAEWVNYFENKSSSAITRLNDGLSSVERELNSVLAATGGTPAVHQDDQILNSIRSIVQGENSASTTRLRDARKISIEDHDGTDEGEPVEFNGSQDIRLRLPANIRADFTGNLTGSASMFGGYTPQEFLSLISAETPIKLTVNTDISKPVNTKYLVTEDNVIVTLKDGAFEGQVIDIMFSKKGSVSRIIGSEVITETSSLGQNCSFIWNGDFWDFFDTNSTGDIKPTLAESAPIGWLMCNGQEVSRTAYSGLFEVIGKKYGAGDGSTTFRVPDLRECVLVGAGQSTRSGLTAHDVYTVGQFKDDCVQGHKHDDSGHSHIYDRTGVHGEGYYATVPYSRNYPDAPAGAWATTSYANIGLPTAYSGYGAPRIGITTHGKQVGVSYIIRY